MAVVIGAVLGLFVFASSLLIGIIYRVPVRDILLRGIIVFWIGFFLGWLIFGNLGISLISKREGAQSEEKGRE
jgi:hypothetical protein